MNKKTKNLIIMILILIFALLIIPNVVLGANASISAGSTTIEKGKNTNISVSISSTETWNLKITSSGGSLSGTVDSTDASDGETSKKVINATFTAKTAGKYTIYLNGQIAGSNLKKQTINKSITITVTEPTTAKPSKGGSSSGGSSNSSSGSSSVTTTKRPTTTTTTTQKEEEPKSTDNKLSALTIKEGAITPEFNKDVREYAVTIPYEVKEVNVTATPNDSKATAAVEGNKDLKEGENTVTVKVTAEDGSESKYLVRVTRARVPIALKSLIIKYENQEGELVELPLNPAFAFNTLEYTLQDLEYWVEKLSVEASPNIEGATIDIQGVDTLQTGENTITITLKIPAENTPKGQEPKEETITYTIKVNKLEEPTLLAKIQDWFKGIMGTVGTWFNNNQTKITLGALAVCIVALIGLSVYIVIDYNKYKDVIAKVKKVSEINANSNIIEEISKNSNISKEKNVDDNNKNDRAKGGKHF